MNDLNIDDNWSKKKRKLLQNFKELSDEDLTYAEGKEDELIERVQQRLGITHYETERLFVSLNMH